MKRNTNFLFIFCLFLFSFNSRLSCAEKVNWHDNIYQSTVYESYTDQLKNFTTNEIASLTHLQKPLNQADPFLAAGSDLIAHIQKKPGKSLNDRRKYHENLTIKLRKAIQLLPQKLATAEQKELSQFIDDLTVHMFTDSQLLPDYWKFLSKNGIKVDGEKELADMLESIYKKTKADGQFKEGDHKSTDSDVLFSGDVPTYIYTYPNQKGTKLFRMGNPTKPTFDKDNKKLDKPLGIADEFTHFIRTYQRRNQKHLYVNHMHRLNHSEEKKTKVIEALDSKFSGTLLVITLDKSSHFYWQEKEYEKDSDASKFKKLLLSKMFDPKGEYFWPGLFNMNAWKAECANIIETIHAGYFDKKKTLSQKDRLKFIDLVHLTILDHVLMTVEPDSANLTCRHSIDRGVTSYSQLYLFQAASHNGGIKKGQLKDLVAMTFGPSLLAHNRPFHSYRLERLQGTSEALKELEAE